MGSPIDLRFDPIFVAKKIVDVDLTEFPERVVAGEEDGGCSFYTKIYIIENNQGSSEQQLAILIQRLKDQLKTAQSKEKAE
jgi:hypothetical protein